MQVQQEPTIYQGLLADSRRWEGFVHRNDDIVISAPSKCGTTWMQMLVAMMIFDTLDLPAPLSNLSPWLDMTTSPLEDVHHQLASQSHRRFIKTHVPLDGLPIDDRVTYLVVGRDPRDVWASMEHHRENFSRERARALRRQAMGDTGVSEITEIEYPRERTSWFRFQSELARGRDHTQAHLAHVLHHLHTGWERRHERNVHLFHYADLHGDLLPELERLAAALDIELEACRLEELSQGASLSAMRFQATERAPEASKGLWKDPAAFFRSGKVGEWRTRFHPEDLRHYEDRVSELVAGDQAFLEWVHRGWRAASPR